MLLAREQGLPVVAVAALVQRPLTSLMATGKSGVRSVRDLRGKRVGTAGIPYQSAYLKTILERANVPESSVKETNVGASLLPAMLSGKVDATLGAFWNVEGVELRQRGAAALDRARSTGSACPTTTSWCWSRTRTSSTTSATTCACSSRPSPRGAARRRAGTRAAPRQALLDANPDLKPKPTRASVRVTIPALFPEKRDRPWGYMDPVAVAQLRRLDGRQRLLKDLPDVDEAITNDLLPGAGL